jgi:hypothetical protein
MTMSIKIARTLRMALNKRLDEIDEMIHIGSPQARHRILEANHILHTLANQLHREATKSNAEREDEGAEKLIRKDPKKRERRTDLRKNRVEFEKDPDLQGLNRGDGGDPDLSRRDRKMGSDLDVVERRLLSIAKSALSHESVSQQARKNLRKNTYQDKDSNKTVSFETAYTKGNPSAVADLKKETSRLKKEQKEEGGGGLLNPLDSLKPSQKLLFSEIAKGKEISTLTLVEELVLQESISSLIEVKVELEKKGVVEPPPEKKKRKTRSDKGVPRGPYTKRVKEELEKILPDEIAGENTAESVDLDILSSTRLLDAKSLNNALSSMVETSKKEVAKSEAQSKKKLVVEKKETKRDVAQLKSILESTPDNTNVKKLMEGVSELDENQLEEMQEAKENKEEDIIAVVLDEGDLNEYIKDGQEKVDISSPSGLGEGIALEKAKEGLLRDPIWSYPSPPSDPKALEEHNDYVLSSVFASYSGMDRELQSEVLSSSLERREKLLEEIKSNTEGKKEKEDQLSNLNMAISSMNIFSILEGDEPLKGFNEVPKDIVSLAEVKRSVPMLKMIALMSDHGQSNIDMREATKTALAEVSDEDFIDSMGGDTGPYGDLLKMLDPSFCPPSLNNNDASEGECPSPMTDEDRKVIRDTITTLFLDGQSLKRINEGASKKKFKTKKNEDEQNFDAHSESDVSGFEEYESILFEDGPPSKEKFEEFGDMVREENLRRLDQEQGLPKNIQNAVRGRGRPKKKPGDSKGKYTRREKPEGPLDGSSKDDTAPAKNKGGRPRKKPGDPKGKYTRRLEPQEGQGRDNDLLEEIRKRHEALWNELERDFG